MVKALNDDAKEIVVDDLKGKSFNEAFSIVTDNILKSGFITEERVVILLYSTGEMDKKEVEEKVGKVIELKGIQYIMINPQF